APRDPADGAPAPGVRRARRDRLRTRRRRAAHRLRGREPHQGGDRPRRHAHHALHAHPALHRARPRARVRERPHRGAGRRRARPPPRGGGLRSVPEGRCLMALIEVDAAKFDEATEALKDVVDPELDVNIVDLGLIYDLAWDDEQDALVVSMTLTS